MSRVTKRSGKVMVIVPNSFCIWYRVYKKMSLSMGRFKFGYEEDYSIGRLKAIVLSVSLSIEKVFGLQALIPFATDEFELLPENIRRYFGILERAIPYKQYYGYAIGVICTNS